jgi:2'-5' RNA ligase
MAHTDTSEIIRAAVWLRPTGEALERIAKAVRLAHKEAGGPQVPPHITLLSGVETTLASAGVKLKHLAARMKPFVLELGEIGAGDDYFHSLFAKAEPSEELAAAQRAAYDAFEMNPAPPFAPHLSLAYGKIDDAVKKRIAEEAGGRLDAGFEVRAVYLVNSTSGVPVSAWRTLIEHSLAAA